MFLINILMKVSYLYPIHIKIYINSLWISLWMVHRFDHCRRSSSLFHGQFLIMSSIPEGYCDTNLFTQECTQRVLSHSMLKTIWMVIALCPTVMWTSWNDHRECLSRWIYDLSRDGEIITIENWSHGIFRRIWIDIVNYQIFGILYILRERVRE